MNKIQRLTKLLMLPSWGSAEITEYAELTDHFICSTHVQKIKTLAMQNGGKVMYRTGRVSVESVLNQFGTSRKEELELLKLASEVICNVEN